ncbi:unnamed protein product [Eruca vesicaria subsp. sativa]|uniref:Uncharacterized protein n=1 Tax=Eruca vesicaria subsp. sativa TaxID=29727 RepID=A0ABC8L6T3_ERUVS|nr:unnamed protein product [Eruca vesicaria subsp. sativa]
MKPELENESPATFGAAVNGYGHGIVHLVLQSSIIADSFKDSASGFGFVLWNLIGAVGGIGGTVVPTIMAGHVIIPGWLCAYVLSATLSTMIGLLFSFLSLFQLPREKKSSCSIISDHERDEKIAAESSNPVWMESCVAIKDVTKLRTFQIIVSQGIIVPWNAMVF